MTEHIKQTVEKAKKNLSKEVSNREYYSEAERLLNQERERQNALSEHAADLAMVYTDKLDVVPYTGRTRDRDDVVYYRNTPWLTSEKYSNDESEVSFSIKNEGYESSPGSYSVINMLIKNADGEEIKEWFATIGDANATTGFDRAGLSTLQGVTINSGRMINTEVSDKATPELVWSDTEAFESVKDILNWMSTEYADKAKT